MTGTLEILALAAACFVGSHFILSSQPVRGFLTRFLGDPGFQALYSAISMATLIWVIAAYSGAPLEVLWIADKTAHQLQFVIMPVVCILSVAAFSTPNVTLRGGEAHAGTPGAVSGIITITRHPFLCGVVLWSAGHIAATGDIASVILFASMGVLALGGMLHIDHRRQVALGALWGPIAMTTSVIPFQAVIQGRVKIDWRGIGVLRPLGGLALYAVLLAGHSWFAGTTLLPGLLPD